MSRVGFLAMVCGIVAACAGGADAGAAGAGAAPDAATGVLTGLVRLAGDERPVPTRLRNTTDPSVCGDAQTLEDLVVAEAGRGVRNAVARLVDVPAEAIAAPSPRRLVVDNQGCRFHPHVAVASVGDTIVAHNGDAIFHTTHYHGPLTANVGLERRGTAVAHVLERPGLITILCDVHGWMQAYVRVDDHPFHAASDEDGWFRIAAVPPGTYTLELWHERLGTRTLRVDIRAGGTTHVDVEYALNGGEP